MDLSPVPGCQSDLHQERAPSDKPHSGMVAVDREGEELQRGLALADVVKLASSWR